jgi:hypothetical protein
MGDTLISLGLVGSLDVFRAIRDQGRDRVIDLFQWRSGKLAFYAEQTAPHVDFALDLDVLPLIFSGMEASAPGETPVAQWRGRLDEVIGPGGADRVRLGAHAMPPVARHLLDIVRTPMPLRDVLSAMAQTRADREAVASASQSLRAIDVLVGAGLLRWR